MTSRVRLIVADIEAGPGELAALVQQLTAGAIPGRTEELIALPAPMADPPPRPLPSPGPQVLDETTAACEQCGCTWNSPCLDAIDPGCAWNPDAWEAGRAICTSCQPIEARPPRPRRSTKKAKRPIARRRKAPAAHPAATTPAPGRSKLTDAEWRDVKERLANGQGGNGIASLRAYQGRITGAGILARAKKENWKRPTRGGRRPAARRAAPAAPEALLRCPHCGQRTPKSPCSHCFERF